jgi:hypothetical protein
MIRLAADHDAGIASEISTTLNRRLCLTNKIFTYLLAGIPVLASATPAQSELAAAMSDAALFYEPRDEGSLAAQMDRLLLKPEALLAAKSAAWALGDQRYNWESEQRIFLDAVARTLEVAESP